MRKYNIYEFIEYTKQNKNKFYNYCEVVIDPYGNIILAVPSHQETVIRYMMEKENMTREDVMNTIPASYSPHHLIIDKYQLITVWYHGYTHGTHVNKRPNRFQRKALNILESNGLIKPEWVDKTNEYGLYLGRKENRNE
jgi:hypothetical protein